MDRPLQLIVNADDAGIDPARNEGILECFENGIVRSATALVNGRAFGEISLYARAHPELGLGLHFNLTDGQPSGPASRTLASQGIFRPKREVWQAAWAGLLDPEEVAAEFRSQLDRFLETGLTPTHFDGHNHVHVFPGVLEACLMVLRDFPQIRRLRLPREILAALPGPLPSDGVPAPADQELSGPAKALRAAGHPKAAFFRNLADRAAARVP
ncbi:MAG: ChbG/HpnK family deacetylase [Planctomycetes bacterium]|nr:ChbG/HpnK family deacetylase [Planctomycetota bacterium]